MRVSVWPSLKLAGAYSVPVLRECRNLVLPCRGTVVFILHLAAVSRESRGPGGEPNEGAAEPAGSCEGASVWMQLREA